MDLLQTLEIFLSNFKTVSVEVKLTEKFTMGFFWDGIEDSNYVWYRSCPFKVGEFRSIAKYESHIKELEDLLLSQHREWRKDKDKRQVFDTNFDAIYLINDALNNYGITESSDNITFDNDGNQYVTNSIYVNNGSIFTFIGKEEHPNGIEYIKDYIPVLSYYNQIQYKSLLKVMDYFIEYNEMLFKIDMPKINESFTLNKQIEFNISKATDLKNYLERKKMIIHGNSYDFYRLFKNQRPEKKIQWVKGPGHLKHFLHILKKGKIIKTELIFESAVKCIEFTGNEYNKEITIDKIKHGHIPEKTILTSEIILKFFL
jgi:hypothetical protein